MDFQPPHWLPKSGVAHVVRGSTIPAVHGDAVGKDTQCYVFFSIWVNNQEKKGTKCGDYLWRTRFFSITKVADSIAGKTRLQFHWWSQPWPIALVSAILYIELVLLPTKLDLRWEPNPSKQQLRFQSTTKRKPNLIQWLYSPQTHWILFVWDGIWDQFEGLNCLKTTLLI